MNYFFTKRDGANRATLVINGKKVGRVHFRAADAWLNPYNRDTLKSKAELEKLGMVVELDPQSDTFPIKVYVNTTNESEIASILSKAFYDQ